VKGGLILNRNLLLFYIARAAGLIIKPLTLWLLVYIEAIDLGALFATVFFIIPSTFIALNSEAHANYYKYQFGQPIGSPIVVGLAYQRYIRLFSTHCLFFLPLALVGFILYFGSLREGLIFTSLVLIEKIWDEFCRHQLFSKKYTTWAKWYFLRCLLTASTVGFALQWGINALNWFFYQQVALICFLAYVYYSERGCKFYLSAVYGYSRYRFKWYWAKYKQTFFWGQMIALAGANILAMDKWYLRGWADSRILIEVMLLAQVGAVYLVIIDNVFFAVNRDRYVKVKSSLLEITNWKNLIIISSSFYLLVTLFVMFLGPYIGVTTVGKVSAMGLLGIFIIHGATRPFSEYAFWHATRRSSAIIELIAFLSVGGAYYISLINKSLPMMYGLGLSTVCIRFYAYRHLCAGALGRSNR